MSKTHMFLCVFPTDHVENTYVFMAVPTDHVENTCRNHVTTTHNGMAPLGIALVSALASTPSWPVWAATKNGAALPPHAYFLSQAWGILGSALTARGRQGYSSGVPSLLAAGSGILGAARTAL